MPAFVIQPAAGFPAPLNQALDFGPDPLILAFGPIALTGGTPVNQINAGTFVVTRASGDETPNPSGAAGQILFGNVGYYKVRVQFHIANGSTAGPIAAQLAAGSGAVVMGGDNAGVQSQFASASQPYDFACEWTVFIAAVSTTGPVVTLTVGGPNGVSTVNAGVIVTQIA